MLRTELSRKAGHAGADPATSGFGAHSSKAGAGFGPPAPAVSRRPIEQGHRRTLAQMRNSQQRSRPFSPSARERYRLPDVRCPKPLRRHAALVQRPRQFANRFVDSLWRQLKRAEMHGDAVARREIEVRLHGFCRIHVDVFHEPARLVRPDGKEREIDGT